MRRGAARIGAAWVASLVLATVLGGALGWSIRSYLEPAGTVATESARPTPSSLASVAMDPPTPAASPVAGSAPGASSPPAPTTPIAAVVPSTRLTVTSVPAALPLPPPDRRLTALTLLTEDFASNRAGWPDDPRATAWLDAGAYRLVARHPGQFVAIPAPVDEALRDVRLTGTFRKVGGPPGGGYGLILRARGPWARPGFDQGVRFYVLGVGDRGEVGIWRREEGHWVDLLPWTPSDAVRPGTAPNEVTALAVGARLALEVNGTRVATVDEHELDVGAVGVFVGGDFNEVALERLTVEALH
jgi:hypothetical protein